MGVGVCDCAGADQAQRAPRQPLAHEVHAIVPAPGVHQLVLLEEPAGKREQLLDRMLDLPDTEVALQLLPEYESAQLSRRQLTVDWVVLRSERAFKMTDEKMTLGQAIDLVEKALASFEAQDQQTILMAVCSHLKIGLPPQVLPGSREALHPPPPAHVAGSARGLDAGIDIKTLKNQKQPASAKQMACLVAYYLAEIAPEAERKQTVTVADLEKYFKQAGYPQAKMDQLLVDGKRSGYFDSKARGEYALNRVGHNLVAHQMPKKSGD
jgi:hypothetical protein